MANPELIEYAKNQLNAGSSPNYIRTVLIKQGWGERDVDDAIGIAQTEAGPVMEEPAPAKAGEAKPRAGKNKFLIIAAILTGVFFLVSAVLSIMTEMQLLAGLNMLPLAAAAIELIAGVFWIIIAVMEFKK